MRPWQAKGHPLGAPPKLVRRFALYAGVALIVAAIAAFFYRPPLRRTARREDGGRTHRVPGRIGPPAPAARLRLPPRRRPARGSPRLDRFAAEQLLSPGILRVKLYAPNGLVVYSSDHQLIGGYSLEPSDMLEAFEGNPAGDVSHLDDEGGTGARQDGAGELRAGLLGGPTRSGSSSSTATTGRSPSDARSIFIPLAIGIAAVLLGLYLSFFPILRRVTRTMRGQIEEIEHTPTTTPHRPAEPDAVQRCGPKPAVSEAKANGGRLAVMLIDLDRFKDVNDTLGHDSGDRLLQALASTCREQMRHDDTVARLGGDEFGVLAIGIDDPTAVLALAQKVRAVLGRAADRSTASSCRSTPASGSRSTPTTAPTPRP